MVAALACLFVVGFFVLRRRRKTNHHLSQLKDQAAPAYSSSLDGASPRTTKAGSMDALSGEPDSSNSLTPTGRISAFSFKSQLGRQDTKGSNEDPLISVEDAEAGTAEHLRWPPDSPAAYSVTVELLTLSDYTARINSIKTSPKRHPPVSQYSNTTQSCASSRGMTAYMRK